MANSLFGRYDAAVTAIASLALAVLAALLVDRALTRAYARRPQAMRDPALDTRLTFLRRVLEATIVLIGAAVALSEFTALDRLAASVLASGAIAAAVVGFAARQVLANGIAGMMLALTQPLRIGDVVTIEGESGTVEDVRLTATYLRAGTGARIVVPNERLAAGILRNDTLTGGIDDRITAEASLWIGHGADEEAAIAAIEGALDGVAVTIAEVTEGGVRLLLARDGVAPPQRNATEAELRRAGLVALRAAAVARPDAGGTPAPG